LLLTDRICNLCGLAKEIEILPNRFLSSDIIATKSVLIEDIIRLV
jgi:hypothetical protein